MNKRYLGLYFLMLCILFLFPPCIGQGNGYYVGHVFILNVGTFVDVPTPNGIAKSMAFLAEIAWQKVAIETLAISAFVGMLRALSVFERVGAFRLGKMPAGNSFVTFEKLSSVIRMIVIPSVITIVGIYLVWRSLSGEIGAWGYLGLIASLTGFLTLASNYKKI